MLAQGWRGFCIALTLPLASGCASSQLNYNTLDLASTTDSLLTRQILYNFSNFIDSAVAVPAQMVISSGTATTSNSVSPTISAPLNAGLTTTSTMLRAAAPTTTNTVTSQTASNTLGVSASDAWNQSWAYAPVTDPDRLKRLQALYRYAVDWSDRTTGEATFVRNFPLVYKSVSYNQPLCLRDMHDTKKKALAKEADSLDLDLAEKPTNGPVASSADKISVCVTAAGVSGSGLQHGATTETFTRQTPDEHYLTPPTCIVCYSSHGRVINHAIRGPWLRWEDVSGGSVRPDRLPRPGDVQLGQSGHYRFFVGQQHAQQFVDFTVAVLSASTVAGSASPTASGTSASGGASGAKALFAIDPNGNIVTFSPAP